MNVYDATRARLDYVFREFDNVFVSFSGGKDSGALLNLCLQHMRENHLGRKIGVLHIDYEAQYAMTTEYVDRVLASNLDLITPYRVCLPLRARCATSHQQTYWTPWEYEKRNLWVRPLPPNAIHERNHPFDFFVPGMSDSEFQWKFCAWYHRHMNARRTCAMIGIRVQESLNRWRAVHSLRNYRVYKGITWTREMARKVYNVYPIHDWDVEDVWTANAKFNWDYNRLYDIFHLAGVALERMRVASPFNDWATESLKFYRAIDPDNWGKMIGRVNGVNFTGIYGGTVAMGWKDIKLPNGHTWKSFLEFLLLTLPAPLRESYVTKLKGFIEDLKRKGNILSEERRQELRESGLLIDVGGGKGPLRVEDVSDADLEEYQHIPTYKRMCICIMKNDHQCSSMGHAVNRNEQERKRLIMAKYQDML
jgi:predicted phosphoadenosine phosphosulfate sulfurtransferase